MAQHMQENGYMNELNALNNLNLHQRGDYNTWHTLKYVSTCDGRTHDVLKTPLKDTDLEQRLESMRHDGLVERRDVSHWLFWTRPAYFISEQGRNILEQEQKKVTSVADAITAAGKDKAAEIMKEHGYKPHDYAVMKSILAKGIFDYEQPGIFTREERLGDYISQRYERRIKAAKESRTSAYDYDDCDFLTTFLLMDVMTDGHLDFNFSPDDYGSLDYDGSGLDSDGDFDCDCD